MRLNSQRIAGSAGPPQQGVGHVHADPAAMPIAVSTPVRRESSRLLRDTIAEVGPRADDGKEG